MKLLLDKRNKIIAIGKTIEFGVWGNVADLSSWKIDGTEFTMDSNYTLVDIGEAEIPTYVNAGEYYYIDGEFRLGDECPNEYKERIKVLEEEKAVLQGQMATQSAVIDELLTVILPALMGE